MKKKFKLTTALTSFIMLFSLALYGCGGATTEKPGNNNKTSDSATEQKNPEGTQDKTSPNKTAEDQETENDLYQRAEKIASAVKTVDGVEDATVVITEKRALVGVDIGKNTEGKLTDKIKDSVEAKVKETDKEIQTIGVSADPDLFTRISKVGQGIQGGKPLSEFGSEIEEIFNRVVPK